MPYYFPWHENFKPYNKMRPNILYTVFYVSLYKVRVSCSMQILRDREKTVAICWIQKRKVSQNQVWILTQRKLCSKCNEKKGNGILYITVSEANFHIFIYRLLWNLMFYDVSFNKHKAFHNAQGFMNVTWDYNAFRWRGSIWNDL